MVSNFPTEITDEEAVLGFRLGRFRDPDNLITGSREFYSVVCRLISKSSFIFKFKEDHGERSLDCWTERRDDARLNRSAVKAARRASAP
jgi:hypothetical protein